jgi:hypothetical protein
MKTRNKTEFKVVEYSGMFAVYKLINGNYSDRMITQFLYINEEEREQALAWANTFAQSENLLDILEQQIDSTAIGSIINMAAQQLYYNCLGFHRAIHYDSCSLAADAIEDYYDEFEENHSLEKHVEKEVLANLMTQQFEDLKPKRSDFPDELIVKLKDRLATVKFEKQLLLSRLEKLKFAEQLEFQKKKHLRTNLTEIQDSIKRVKSWIAEY